MATIVAREDARMRELGQALAVRPMPVAVEQDFGRRVAQGREAERILARGNVEASESEALEADARLGCLARDRLVEYMPPVLSVARRYAGRGMDVDDRRQEGSRPSPWPSCAPWPTPDGYRYSSPPPSAVSHVWLAGERANTDVGARSPRDI